MNKTLLKPTIGNITPYILAIEELEKAQDHINGLHRNLKQKGLTKEYALKVITHIVNGYQNAFKEIEQSLEGKYGIESSRSDGVVEETLKGPSEGE